ncbi:MAG: metallophosphoesterase [Clostridia bacterium]|nr:metallophosphoesterase [Clostridia bacterium]
MKKLICLLLAVLMLCGLTVTASAADAETAEFAPVLRFVLASDTHILGDNDSEEQRIQKMMELAYKEAERDKSYQTIDALLIAGDLTNDGVKDEFERFWGAVSASLKGETRFLGVVAKNHDGYEMGRSELRGYYEQLTGNDADFHVVIGGYHFIGLSVSANKSKHYDKDQLKWLDSQLAEATADDAEKPVFVMHHEHVRNTVYGSSSFDGWGVKFFTDILKNYPQVVDVSGHSHYPINHPGSIWQGAFTALGTGAVYYSEFTIDKARCYHPADAYETSTFRIVELDAQNNMRLRGYDVLAGEQICEDILANPAKADNRDYAPDKREAASLAPAFGDTAEITAEKEFGKLTVTVPAAASQDGMPVVLYRAELKTKSGKSWDKVWTLPPYYRAAQSTSASLEFTDLPAGEYIVCVTAENAYGKASEPLELTVTVDGSKGWKAAGTRIAHAFGKIKDFFANLF